MQVDYAAIVQVCLYTFILITGSQQLHTAYKSRNKSLSIRNGIVALLTLAAFVRIIFWVKTCVPGSLNDEFMMIIFFMPLWLNFCGLSLLVVFYAEAVYGGKSKWPMRLCALGNIVLLVLNIIIASGIASELKENTKDPSDSDLAFAAASTLYSSSLDFILAILLFIYGYRFQSLCNESGNALTTWTPNSVSIFESINWMLIIVYIFRGIAAAVIAQHPDVLGEVAYNGNHEPTRGSVCIFFFITEILPSFCVILMLWRITGTTRLGVSTIDNSLNTRLLSIEDSKVRVLMGQESLLQNEDNDYNRNIFGESETDDASYLLFSPSPIKGAREENNQYGLSPQTDSERLLSSSANLEEGNIITDNTVSNPPIDISKYSISAESSFINDNKDLFEKGGIDDNHVDAINARSSPVVIAGKVADAVSVVSGAPGYDSSINTDSSSIPRLSFGRRGSWNRRENMKNFISKRTPSPGLIGEQRLSDADSDNPMLIGSAPISAGSIGSFQSSSGNSLGSSAAHGSFNNLASAGIVNGSIKEDEGDQEQSDKEKYANTAGPRDILLQQQQYKAKKHQKNKRK